MKKNFKNQKPIISTIIFFILIFGAITAIFSIDRKTNEKVVEYISASGWITESSPFEISHIKIPTEFDDIYKSYNEIQKKSGFNLEDYKGKTATKYSYKVLNHKKSSTQTVSANVFICDGKIIAADLSAKGETGFITYIGDKENFLPN